jgi:hypothetical protein
MHQQEKTMAKEKMTRSEKAEEYRLQQARELLKNMGYVQGPGDTWTPASMGRLGGKARAKNLTKEQLTAIGRKGAQKRWAKKPVKKGGKGQ